MGSYGDIFVIGVLNTVYISVLAIIASTILGFTIGVLRLSEQLAGLQVWRWPMWKFFVIPHY